MKSDVELTKDVLARLEFDPTLDAGGLGVSVRKGIVTLQGALNSGEDRRATECAVKLVPGVKGLVDRIRVALPEADSPSDAEITGVATEAIKWLTTIPPESVSVTVQDGWVSLKGTVESWHDREALEEVMRHLPQVKGVNNLLEQRA